MIACAWPPEHMIASESALIPIGHEKEISEVTNKAIVSGGSGVQ